MRRLSPLAVALFLIVDVNTALAGNAGTPGARVMVDLRFADSAGITQNITVPLAAASAGAVKNACGDKPTLETLASAVVGRTPKLAGTTFVSAACEVDRAGRPILSPTQVSKPAPYKHPAVIVLKYKDKSGSVLQTVIGTKEHPVVDIENCQQYLHIYQNVLIKHTSDHRAGETFLGASCVAASANVNVILNSAN